MESRLCIQVILLMVCTVHFAESELFTALVDLERVLHAEHGVAQDLREYIAKEETRLDMLRRIANDYENHSTQALNDAVNHLANPVNAFLLVKRFTSDWQQVEQLVQGDHSQEFLQMIADKTANFPDESDLNGAAVALLRLQDTYALSAHKLAKGEIEGVKYSPELSAEACFELGKIAYNAGDHYHTILWMQESLERLDREVTKTIDRAALLDYFSFSLYMQGNVVHALNLTHQWLELEPDHERAQNNKKYYLQMLEEQPELQAAQDGKEDVPQLKNERPLDEYRRSEEFAIYEGLCRGEETHKNPDARKLTCQYKRHHPFTYIRPMKEEVMYLDPFIAVYHDLLTDTEIAKIKELATPKLQRATVQNPRTGVLEPAFYRVSKSAWLKDHEDPLVASTSGKTKILTGLTLDTVEELQVVNYGIGGHYEPHYDFARPEEKTSFDDHSGNRIATVIFYMSDVEAGGATVFPQIGVKLWPRKGSCAFWHNLRASGEGDYMTRHAACPVLTGTKWVCNKWFHERGQEFARPCGLDPLE